LGHILRKTLDHLFDGAEDLHGEWGDFNIAQRREKIEALKNSLKNLKNRYKPQKSSMKRQETFNSLQKSLEPYSDEELEEVLPAILELLVDYRRENFAIVHKDAS
jgi:hypothetical protein